MHGILCFLLSHVKPIMMSECDHVPQFYVLFDIPTQTDCLSFLLRLGPILSLIIYLSLSLPSSVLNIFRLITSVFQCQVLRILTVLSSFSSSVIIFSNAYVCIYSIWCYTHTDNNRDTPTHPSTLSLSLSDSCM